MLHEALIVPLKQNLKKRRCRSYFRLETSICKILKVAKNWREHIERTFWNLFWKAYPRQWQSKEFTCWWVSDINGDWIWTRRKELPRVLTGLDAIKTQRNTWLILKVSYHFRQRNPEQLLKLAAGFSQKLTGNSAFQSRFRVLEKMMSVTSFTIVNQL